MCELQSVFRALADTRRRAALSCLQKHQTVFLPDLAEHVAEQERGTDVTTISEEWVRDVYFSLYHKHVPRLEEANLVQYEQSDDVVVKTDRVGEALMEVREAVDSLRQTS
ncbi:hypothetical protein HUG10_07665 [Halorarum halophilum]|uniref:DUF7344 domain-containing protein n=1 Tax=Halorarum halophilum TaxID=2743090 RepID=A0A7D5GBF9_9EURY|nr:hypothetical protein [Halobaculum halophilum]QLG27432.1 hypothetical protein HUG10_07665 [Halobaculum halophilum]